MPHNNSIMFDSKSFTYYMSLLEAQDNRTIIIGLQEIFFRLKMGYVLFRYQRRLLEPQIIRLISKSKDTRVRRWAYMVGAFCNNEELVHASKMRLEKETDFENRTWIMALLSVNLDETEFNKEVLRLNHGLTEDNIKLAIYLFSNSTKYRITDNEVKKMAEKNDKISLFWIGSIAAYSDLAQIRRKEIIIPENLISDLTNHEDDEVLKHIMYAYSFKRKFSVKQELKFDYYDYANMQPHHKKWFLTAIWKDKKFIRNNPEYIKEILEPGHLFLNCDKRVREGLARGLSEYDFDSSLVRSILEWISRENETSVLHFLLLYVLKWKDLCKEYQEIVNDELLYGGKIEENIINAFNSGKTTTNKKREDNHSSKYIFQLAKKIINKEENLMRDQYNNWGSVGNQGPGSGKESVIVQLINNGEEDLDYEELLTEMKKLKECLYNEPRTEKNEILIGEIAQIQQAAKEKNKKKFMDILNGAGTELYDIAKRIGCSLLASYLSLTLGIK